MPTPEYQREHSTLKSSCDKALDCTQTNLFTKVCEGREYRYQKVQR